MKIAIDISEELYEHIKRGENYYVDREDLMAIIREGTVLSENQESLTENDN